jgi:hypothetical protein
VFVTDDPAGIGSDRRPAFPEGTDASVERIGDHAGRGAGPSGGCDPAALFQSRDGGFTWELNRAPWTSLPQ